MKVDLNRVSIVIITAFVTLCGWPRPALGDGGSVRAWKQQGTLDIAVFSEPTPVVVGLVDLSVLILDRKTGEPIPGARVMVELTPIGQDGKAERHPASEQTATNKLLRAAEFEIRAAGRYRVLVEIETAGENVSIPFDLDVGERSSPRSGDWPWIFWPAGVVVLFGIHRRLVARRDRVRG